MGKEWDYDVPSEEVWAECLRVLKPGGHLLAFAGTRTQHRMAVRIEDAGFEIRDMIAWVYGSGFPKSLDVSKAIDKAAGMEREVIGKAAGMGKQNPEWNGTAQGRAENSFKPEYNLTAPATDAARQWQGWGTALKPSHETVTWATKPLTTMQERDITLSNLIRLEARLWLLSSASAAEKSSTLSQSEYGAACAIAQWSADEITSTRADLCALMDTSLFELATTTSLNIVSSWRRTLAESWNDGNTSTIEMRLSTTIDWKTLKFSLSQITPASIIEACSLPGGFDANASIAENHFNASLSLLQSILTLSATEPAISLEAEACRDGGVKPSLDPCIMARKPLIGTVAENVLAHGTGAINVDGCRVGTTDDCARAPALVDDTAAGFGKGLAMGGRGHEAGRWPANLIHDGSEEVSRLMTGGEARFFYTAKASKDDRDEGCEEFETRQTVGGGGMTAAGGAYGSIKAPAKNHHPTVKPTDLMRHLCRLVTPPGGIVLDPFMGSGSTGKAAILEGFSFIGIERESEYVEIARARIDAVSNQPKQQALF